MMGETGQKWSVDILIIIRADMFLDQFCCTTLLIHDYFALPVHVLGLNCLVLGLESYVGNFWQIALSVLLLLLRLVIAFRLFSLWFSLAFCSEDNICFVLNFVIITMFGVCVEETRAC